jgi:hypothetical protein
MLPLLDNTRHASSAKAERVLAWKAHCPKRLWTWTRGIRAQRDKNRILKTTAGAKDFGFP